VLADRSTRNDREQVPGSLHARTIVDRRCPLLCLFRRGSYLVGAGIVGLALLFVILRILLRM